MTMTMTGQARMHKARMKVPQTETGDFAEYGSRAAGIEVAVRTAVVPPYPTIERRSSASDDPLGGSDAGPEVCAALRRANGAGRPLDRVDAHRFGQGFGADLSAVRLHTDGQADDLARSVQATAFTHGSDIYFSHGTFTPGTEAGDHLLAHELAHVVQGSTGRWDAAGGSGVRIGRADDAAESAADAAADSVMAQLRHGAPLDPVVAGALPAAAGEPIARTVRRASLKSLAKKVKKKVTRATSPHPAPTRRTGVVPIAQLRAASDAAHAARHRPSSGMSLSSGPIGGSRSSSQSSRSRYHDDPGLATESGEGADPLLSLESESAEEPLAYGVPSLGGQDGDGVPPAGEQYQMGGTIDFGSESSES
jgi:hypothetical protein